MIEDRLGRFERRLADDGDEVVDADGLVDRLVEKLHALAGDARAGGMRVADEGVAGGEHVDGVAGQRRQRMRDRRDDADDAERGVLFERDAVLAAEGVGAEELDAGRFSPATISFSILCLSRPILVSSNSSRPSISALSMQILRMQSIAFLRSVQAERIELLLRLAAAATASSTLSKTPQAPPALWEAWGAGAPPPCGKALLARHCGSDRR